MSPKRTFLCLALFISFFQYLSQTTTLDSLKLVLKHSTTDTVRISTLLNIGYEEWIERTTFWDSLIKECDLSIAKRPVKQIEKALLNYKGSALTVLGFMYEQQGQQVKALESYQASLKIQEQINNNEEMIMTLVNIGMVYLQQDNFLLANEYFNKSIAVNQKSVKDSVTLYKAYNNIATVYQKKKEHEKALEYHFKCLKIAEMIQFERGIAMSDYNIGVTYSDQDELLVALQFYEKALIKMKAIKDETGTAYSFYGIGRTAFKKGDLSTALDNGSKSLEIGKRTKNIDVIKIAADLLFDVYKKTGKYKEALAMHELHIAMKDSINNETTRKQTLKKQFEYEYDKKETQVKAEAKAEKEKIELKAAEDTKRQNIIIYSVMAGLLLVSIFSVFIFRGLQKNKKANKIITQQNKTVEEKNRLIEEKQKEIIDSINYAQRIQRSLLASKDLLDQNLENYFVLFKPKDIVSGDFYWAAKLNNGNFAIVTADSTGHGVPGAIMSMLNIACLNESVSNGFTSPHDILSETRSSIIEHLKNDGSESGGKDGMDCSLLCIDHKNKLLYAAAANNPIWIMRSSEVIEIKPDKMPVGKHDKDTEPFTMHKIELQAGDILYTLTDGFPDQFGGEKGKKFMSKNLKELLRSISHLPLSEQKAALELAFDKWVGQLEQIDDVTVIGIQIGQS